MARRAYTRTLKSGKVVRVRASFSGSPNRAPGKLDLHNAFHDKVGGQTYMGADGNYRFKLASGKPGGAVTPWNKAVKERFASQIEFHQAANDYVRGIGLPDPNARTDGK